MKSCHNPLKEIKEHIWLLRLSFLSRFKALPAAVEPAGAVTDRLSSNL